jgi:hypothetical protein
MSVFVANLDSIVFAIPLVGLLVSAFFRVDELVGKPSKHISHRRQMAGLDCNGMPLCLDPDGRLPIQARKAA